MNSQDIQNAIASQKIIQSFNPTQITSLKAWYDATDFDSITQSSDAVSQLNDKSGLANHVVQATSGNKPTVKYQTGANGMPYINFPAGTKNLALSSFVYPQPYTLYFVIRQNAIANNATVFQFNSFTNGIAQRTQTNSATGSLYNTLCPVADTAWAGQYYTVGSYNNNWTLYKIVMDTAPILSMNNANDYPMTTSAGGSGTVQMMIGGSSACANFDFHEMMFFSGYLNDNDDRRVQDYFMTKYSFKPLDYLNWFGDSITAGNVTTDTFTQGFAGLTSFEKGKPQNNLAISGAAVYHGLAGSDFISKIKNIKYYPGNGWLIICFGTNDAMDSNWVPTYTAEINRLVRLGWPKSKIILMTPQYQPALSGGSTMHTNVISVAANIPGILLADYWAVTLISDPTGSTLADGKHPNVTGHRNWATWLETNFIQN